jgi:pantoate--beta-alanine ligase
MRLQYVVVSVFVNPKHFGAGEDLESYPRALEVDCAKLRGLADAVVAPQAQEIYPADFSTSVSLAPFLKGKVEHVRRPHFFNGVATVVTKLISAIAADAAFFGQKDGLQCAVVCRLVRDLAADKGGHMSHRA